MLTYADVCRFVFFDDTSHIGEPQLRAAHAHFDAIIVGSHWNFQVLTERGLRTNLEIVAYVY